MRSAISRTDAIRLTLLESMAWGSSTTRRLELELRETLPLAGVLSKDQITRVLVDAVLTELERAGFAVCFGACDDVGDDGQPRSGAEQVWIITAAGTAELERLRRRAAGNSR